MFCKVIKCTKNESFIQVISALLAQKLVVTVQYVADLVDAILNKTKQPDPNEYV